MKVIKPSVEALTPLGIDLVLQIETAGRTCYKSEGKGSYEASEQFVRKLILSGHEAMVEHASVTFRIICDRGVTHEIVRHRLASYAQESTRYCNYAKDKFGNELTFIKPLFWEEDSAQYKLWYNMCEEAEQAYMALINAKATPQEARSVLPNSLKTEIVVTMDVREWRHFLKLRCAPDAHPQMREVALEILRQFRESVPVLVEDISGYEV